MINFYPVINEATYDVSPVDSALNTVRDRLEKLHEAYKSIERTHEVFEAAKSLIQGTIDAGVLGGLPRYKVNFNTNFNVIRVQNSKIFQNSNLIEILRRFLPGEQSRVW